MTEPIAYCRGEWTPVSRAGVPLADAGFVLGATITEQLRTFDGKLFLWDEHVARMRRSLASLRLDEQIDFAQVRAIADRVVEHNFPLLPTGGDLGVAVLITPGWYPAFSEGVAPPGASGPHLYVHSYPLPFARWAKSYDDGVSVISTLVAHPDSDALPRHIKSRSRLHYHLADLDANRRVAGARALWLDADGFVLETSTSNIVLCSEKPGHAPHLVIPPRADVLPGISLGHVLRLAHELGWPVSERRISTAEFAAAGEAWATSTPFCALPITSFNERPIGNARPGPRFQELIAAWSRHLNLDVIAQARTIAGVS
ncbi:MAG TPA: aminotransferase class IV [Pirellulales bacterium]